MKAHTQPEVELILHLQNFSEFLQNLWNPCRISDTVFFKTKQCFGLLTRWYLKKKLGNSDAPYNYTKTKLGNILAKLAL